MKKLYFFAILILFGISISNSFGQAAGDNCSNAITLTPSTGGCTSAGPYTNVGFTSVGDPIPSCWGTAPDNSVWFKFVATAAQVTINTNFTTGPGDITNTQLALYSGACGSLTMLNCNEDIGPGNTMAGLTQYGLTIGATYYIMVDGNAQTGGFNICIENLAIPPPAAPGKDCSTATPLCDKSPVTFDPLAAGFGSLDETNGTCITFGEHQSTMVTFTVQTTGTLSFVIDPKGATEYDWVLFQGPCPITNSSDISCNYNYATSTGSSTGMGTAPAGAVAGEFTASITVTAGVTYYLLISNFDDDNKGFDLSWGGTCVFAGPKAGFTAVPISGCAPLAVNFTNTSTSATSYSWDFGDGSPVTSATSPSHTYTAGGTYIVTLTAKGAGACLTTDTTVINVISPKADFTATTVCGGNVTTFTNTSVNSNTYQWDFTNDGIIDNLTSNPTFTFPGAGTYTTKLICTNTATGCKDSIIKTVIVTSPIITITPSAPMICSGTSVNLSATITPNPATYPLTFSNTSWDSIPDAVKAGPTTTPGVLNSTITVSGVSPTIISSGMLVSVCFTVYHPKQSDIQVVTLKAGSGASFSFTPLPLNGNGFTTYCFSSASLANFIGQNPNQVWTLSIQDNNAASKGKTYKGSLFSWYIVINTTNTITSFSWSPTTNMTGSGTLNPTVSPTTTTTYTLSATDATGCSGSKAVVVTVVPATISVNSLTICTGQTTTLTVSGASSYSWSGGETGSTLSVTPASSTSYTVTGTTGSCTSSATASVTIGSSMTIIVNSPSICSGENTSIVASGATDYIWSTTETTATVTVAPTTTTSYTVTGSTSGCSGSAISTVTVGFFPTMSVSSSTICSGSGTSITANGAANYLWSTGETNAILSVAPTTTSTYTVTGTSSTGCTSSTTAEVLVNTQPNITGTATIVDDNCGTGVGSITGLTATGTPTLTYTWSNSTPTIVSTSTTTGDLTNQISGNYTLIVTSNSNTCFATSGPYTIGNTGGPPAPIATSPLPYCQGETITDLTASGTGGTLTWYSDAGLTTAVGTGSSFASGVSNAGASVTTFYVTETTGCQGPSTSVSITVNATPIVSVSPIFTTVNCSTSSTTLTGVGGNTYSWSTTENTTSITVTPTVSSTYTLTATSSAGCTATASAGVTVDLTPPALTVTPTATIDCANPSATLTATGGNNYLWSNTSMNATINVTSAGVYTVTATGTNGCTASAIATVTATAGPIASFVANPTVGSAPLTVNFTNTSSNATTYIWSFGDSNGAITTDATNIYGATGSYQVLLIANQGSCLDSASVTIVVYDNYSLLIPNVFTPNGDNTNDLFTVTSKGVSTLDGEIYDRWGLKMYDWHTVNGGWDGNTTSGNKSSDGTYYYIIKAKGFDGTEHTEKGSLTLMR